MMFPCDIGQQYTLSETSGEASHSPQPSIPSSVRTRTSSVSCVPSAAEVSTTGANTALGQSLFITDCAQCHNFDGAGGALTYGKFAPALTQATNTQMFEAMLTGPEAMPVFANTTITPAQKRDIIDYVTRLRAEPNPGGFSLGRIGPVTEGIVGFLGGIGVLVFLAMWITMKRRES